MFECIWCQRSTASQEPEFVLQSALGGQITCQELACVPCASSFSDRRAGAIDDVLAEQFALLRNALVVYSGDGKEPPTLREVGRTRDGVVFDLAPGLVPVAPHALPAELASQLAPAFRSRPPVGGALTFRAIGKSLFNLAAMFLPRAVVLGKSFDSTRQAIRHGRGELTLDHDYVNVFPRATMLGELDHVLQIVSDPELRMIVGYATLFGEFRFSGVLAVATELPSFTATLVQDPVGRVSHSERSELASFSGFVPPLASAPREACPETRAGIARAFNRVLGAAYDARAADIIGERLEGLMLRLSHAKTDRARASLLKDFTEAAASAVFRLPF